MQTTYQLHTNELDERFTDSLRRLFGDKVIRIVVDEVDQPETLSPELLRRIDDVENGRNLIKVDIDQY